MIWARKGFRALRTRTYIHTYIHTYIVDSSSHGRQCTHDKLTVNSQRELVYHEVVSSYDIRPVITSDAACLSLIGCLRKRDSTISEKQAE